MIYANRNRSNDIELYVSMLDDLLQHRNSDNARSLFERIIHNTHCVVNGKMSFYSIDNDIYDVVSLLISQHSEYFKEPNTVDYSTLEHLMKLLKSEEITA